MLSLELLRVRFPCVLDLILRHLDENDIKHLSSTSSAWNASTKLWRERRLLRRKDLKCPKIISGIKKHLNHGDYPAGVRFLGRDLLVLISSESGDFSINRCVLLKHLPGCTLPKVENIWLDNGCKEYFANEEWIVGYDKFKLKILNRGKSCWQTFNIHCLPWKDHHSRRNVVCGQMSGSGLQTKLFFLTEIIGQQQISSSSTSFQLLVLELGRDIKASSSFVITAILTIPVHRAAEIALNTELIAFVHKEATKRGGAGSSTVKGNCPGLSWKITVRNLEDLSIRWSQACAVKGSYKDKIEISGQFLLHFIVGIKDSVVENLCIYDLADQNISHKVDVISNRICLLQHVFPIGNYLIYEFKSNDQKWVGIHNLLNRGQEGIFRSGSRVFKTALATSIKLINDQYLLILTVTENEAMSFDCHDLKEEEASSARQKQRSCPFSILDLRTSRSSFWTQGDIMPEGEGVAAINAGSCGAERRKILYFNFWK